MMPLYIAVGLVSGYAAMQVIAWETGLSKRETELAVITLIFGAVVQLFVS